MWRQFAPGAERVVWRPMGFPYSTASLQSARTSRNTGGSPKGTPYPTGMVEREKKASPPEGIITLIEAGGSNYLDPPRRDVSQRLRTHAELPRCLAACLSTLFPSTRP